MNDPQRIDNICDRLKTYWKLFPEKNLFQILKDVDILDDSLYMEDSIVYNLLSNALSNVSIAPHYQYKIIKMEKELGVIFNGHSDREAKQWIAKYEDMYHLQLGRYN